MSFLANLNTNSASPKFYNPPNYQSAMPTPPTIVEPADATLVSERMMSGLLAGQDVLRKVRLALPGGQSNQRFGNGMPRARGYVETKLLRAPNVNPKYAINDMIGGLYLGPNPWMRFAGQVARIGVVKHGMCTEHAFMTAFFAAMDTRFNHYKITVCGTKDHDHVIVLLEHRADPNGQIILDAWQLHPQALPCDRCKYTPDLTNTYFSSDANSDVWSSKPRTALQRYLLDYIETRKVLEFKTSRPALLAQAVADDLQRRGEPKLTFRQRLHSEVASLSGKPASFFDGRRFYDPPELDAAVKHRIDTCNPLKLFALRAAQKLVVAKFLGYVAG